MTLLQINNTDNELHFYIILYLELAHDDVRVHFSGSLRQLFMVLRTKISHLLIQIYYIIITSAIILPPLIN